jgi:hypothetical protein
VKYRSADSFRSDFRRLPAEHQRTFQEILRKFFLPAVAAGSFGDSPHWPARLRIHRLDPVLVWRRIGDHGIYDRRDGPAPAS